MNSAFDTASGVLSAALGSPVHNREGSSVRILPWRLEHPKCRRGGDNQAAAFRGSSKAGGKSYPCLQLLGWEMQSKALLGGV